VLVAGGGPAGAAAAFRLTRLGYDVAVVTAPGANDADRIEVLSSSCLHLMDSLPPLANALAASYPVSETQLFWSGCREHVPAAPGTRLVCRSQFDAALLATAGACVIRPVRARAPQRVDGLWHVPITGSVEPPAVAARFLIDACGRASTLTNKSKPFGPATAAIWIRWRNTTMPVGVMLVEAFNEGWCWGATFPPHSAETAMFVDQAFCRGAGRHALARWTAHILRRSKLFASLLREASVVATEIRDATPRRAVAPVGPDWCRVGDAAYASDPLSSQGISAALRSGIQAAAVAHTILSGGDQKAAIDFYHARTSTAADQSRVMTSAFYDRHRDAELPDFWMARTAAGLVQSSRAALPEATSEAAYGRDCTFWPMLVGDRILRFPSDWR